MMRVLLLSLLALSHAQVIVPSTQEVLDNAAISTNKYCSVKVSELDRDAAIQDLKVGAGADNFIYTAIMAAGESEDAQQLSESLAEAADPGFIVGKAVPLVILILTFVVFMFSCWFVCCPCCMRLCCKCCQKKRVLGEKRLCQAVLWLFFIGIGVASLILASLTLRGYNNIDEGFAGTFCSSAQLIEDGVSGTDTFVGMLPAISRLEEIAAALDPATTGGFYSQVGNIVDSTGKINTAYTQVLQSMNQLEQVVSNAENLMPTGMYHTCQICGPLLAQLTPVRQTFESGIGAALRDSRAQVKEQLQGQGAEDLRVLLQQAMEPVRAAKDQILTQVGSLVDPDGFQQNTDQITGPNSQLRPAIFALFFFFLIVFISGFIALGGFCLKHKPSQVDKDPCLVRSCTCCVTCYGCVYAMITLLLGGILVIVAMVGSGVCLVLVEFNYDMGDNLLAAVGTPIDATMDMALIIADRCLSSNSVEPDASRNLADIVLVDAQDGSGGKVTLRESVFDAAVTPVQDSFAAVTGFGGDVSLSSNPALTNLTASLAAVNMKALFWPDSASVFADASPYKDMETLFSGVTLDCNDVTLSDDLIGSLGGSMTYGLDSMVSTGFTSGTETVASLSSQMDVSTWTCPTLAAFTCTAGATNAKCTAGAQFVQNTKTPLATQQLYKCVYQVNPSDNITVCNPRDMSQAGGVWSGMCVSGESIVGAFKVVDCDITELETNLKNIGLDLTKVFQYFDSEATGVNTAISVDLMNLVDTFIIDPLNALLGAFDCAFLGDFWQGLTDSMCLRAMNGLRMIANSYVWVAILSLLISLLMYVPWRLSKDNMDVADAEPVGQASL